MISTAIGQPKHALIRLREGQANVRTILLEAGVGVLSSYDYTKYSYWQSSDDEMTLYSFYLIVDHRLSEDMPSQHG